MSNEKQMGGDDFDGGERVSGGFEGPTWAPHYSEFNDKRRGELLAKLGAGSSDAPAIVGRLKAFSAWGRRIYGVQIDETTIAKLPEHQTLYTALGMVRLGARVKIVYKGRADKAKPGRQAPILYDVFTEKGGSCDMRADALKVHRREDREAVDPEADFPPEE
jgi:hypothetical protein